jgi:GH24 family phage-related lysozyme (muramidase)
MRHSKVRIEPTNAAQVADTSRPAALQVSANPSGPLSAPAPADPLSDLAHALSSISPALARYGSVPVDRQAAEDQLAQGRRARAMQEDSAPVAMTREQDPFWQQGYMEMHGQMAGIEDKTAISEAFEATRNDPDFDFKKFMAQQRSEYLKGMTDKDALKGYLPQLQEVEQKLGFEFAKQNLSKVRTEQVEQTNAVIGDMIHGLGETTHEDAAAKFQTAQTDFVSKGFGTRSEFTQRYVSAMLADPKTAPQDFNHLYIPDASGRAPAYAAGPDGQALDGRIQQAILHAQARADKATAEIQEKKNTTQTLWEENVIRTGTLSQDIPNIEQYVASQGFKGGMYEKPDAARSAMVRLYKAKEDEDFAAMVTRALNGASSLPYAVASDPRVKPRIEQKYLDLWGHVDPANPEQFAQAITASTRLFEQTGVEDKYLKSVAEGVPQMGTEKDSKGQTVLSQQFRSAYSLWKGLRDSTNPQLSMFPKDAQAFLQAFDSAKQRSPEVEAFNEAKRFISPDSKARVESLDPAMEKLAMQQVSSRMTSNFKPNGNGFFADVANSDDIARKVVFDAKMIYARGGIQWKDALQTAQDSRMASLVFDGYKGMWDIPADQPKQKTGEMLNFLVKEAQARQAQDHPDRPDLSQYTVGYRSASDGRLVYTVRDYAGRVIAENSADALEQTWLHSKNATTTDIANAQTQQQGLQAMHDAGASLRDQQAELYNRLTKGTIPMREYLREQAALKVRQEQTFTQYADKFVKTQQAAPQLPPPNMADPSIRTPVPGPVGVELSPKEIALSTAQSDPGTALTAYGEGFRNTVYADTKGQATLGYGYNISARAPEQVRKDLSASGIKDEGRQSRILDGKETITPDEATRLSMLVKKNSINVARDTLGAEVWDALPEHKKAVLIDVAYQAGDHSEAFKSALTNLSVPRLHWTDKSGVPHANTRRDNLRLAMWEGPDKFMQLVKQGL